MNEHVFNMKSIVNEIKNQDTLITSFKTASDAKRVLIVRALRRKTALDDIVGQEMTDETLVALIAHAVRLIETDSKG